MVDTHQSQVPPYPGDEVKLTVSAEYYEFDKVHNVSEDTPIYGITDRSVRNGFIKKVFGIVSVQLLITTIISALFMSSTSVQSLVLGPYQTLLYVISVIFMFGTLICLMCVRNLCKQFPINYIILLIFTLAVSYTVGLVTTQYQAISVIYTCGMTVGISFVLTLYAIFTKTDFTTSGSVLISLLCVIIIGSIFGIFIRNDIYNLIISACSAFVFSLYLIYDIQMVCGGSNRRNQLGPDEYIFAAINIYLDIINLFVDLLSIFGTRNN